MDEAGWGEALTADVLVDRYGLAVDVVEPVHMGTDTINRRVLTTDGLRLFVKQYPAMADLDEARNAWDMSEYCRAARLPVPRVWPDADDNLVTIAEGNAWTVVDEAPGRVTTSAMTIPLAEHIGAVMGRMHRVLAAYPLPKRVQQTRWRTEPVEDAVAKCDRVMARATRQGHDRLDQLRVDLNQRRADFRTHVPRLRKHLPETLVQQALHADLTRTNLVTLADAVTGVIDFRCATAMPAWELGRAAFDPRTVATSSQWAACALAMVGAYRSEHPSLPASDVRACARIALLYMLFSFYGATTAEYGLPGDAEGDLKRHWFERQIAIRCLLSDLEGLEDALTALGASGGTP
ncbi:phosphotransferase enzyme family protein [Streptomyces sp. OK228]|uniref:phosphotransferase enzyme family protein n=1 Tax=Streptomyces sp. OK228 TaxID=1882786 RepID=UPI000BDBBB66|nr:phosphotransferase [Streptomyces sp. OK228]SOE32524.1 homoserine kinase type II [Streptomyces sp. OK228]